MSPQCFQAGASTTIGLSDGTRLLFSYSHLVAMERGDQGIRLDAALWDCSSTTVTHVVAFLGMRPAEIRKAITRGTHNGRPFLLTKGIMYPHE